MGSCEKIYARAGVNLLQGAWHPRHGALVLNDLGSVDLYAAALEPMTTTICQGYKQLRRCQWGPDPEESKALLALQSGDDSVHVLLLSGLWREDTVHKTILTHVTNGPIVDISWHATSPWLAIATRKCTIVIEVGPGEAGFRTVFKTSKGGKLLWMEKRLLINMRSSIVCATVGESWALRELLTPADLGTKASAMCLLKYEAVALDV